MNESNLASLTEAVMRQIFIELEASARHVHLTREQAVSLFGHDLTPKRALSQPGQFVAQERVTLKGPKGTLQSVAVLGPCRSQTQIEISLTDGKILGIEPPLRPSGDTAHSPGITLIGERGTIAANSGVIAAQRHLHLTPETAQRFGLQDQQIVRLQTFTSRPLVFDDVLVRVSSDFADRAHLDFDEANACGMRPGDLGRILP